MCFFISQFNVSFIIYYFIQADDKESPTIESPFHTESGKQSYIPASHYGFQDVSVPFPRTSGARFCGAGMSYNIGC